MKQVVLTGGAGNAPQRSVEYTSRQRCLAWRDGIQSL